MISIYCITDINNINYVGSTKNKIEQRLSNHKVDKKRHLNISSSKLDLDNVTIKLLELCDEDNRMEREGYWINKLDTININRLQGRDPTWREKNKHKIKEWNTKYCKISYEKYKVERLKKAKLKYKYQSSWGGDIRTNNNLLLIDINFFDII
tara:strand:- start:378 stop:833 length:456 start_codon:yes stop_codon:yes gene_type:complete